MRTLDSEDSERGSLVIVLPMLLVLALLGATMWNYQQMLGLTNSVLKSQSDMNLIASNVMRRAYTLLTAPGIQGAAGCGSSVIQNGATSINALLGSFRDFRNAGGPVTLTFNTATMTGNMGPSCLLLATELPPSNYSLGTITLNVSQMEAPNFTTLSRKLLVQVIATSSGTQADQNGQQKSFAISKVVTLQVASLAQYGVVIRNLNTSPFFWMPTNNNLNIMSPVYDASTSSVTIADTTVLGASLGMPNPSIFGPFHMRGLGFYSTAAYSLGGLTQVFRGGLVTNVFNSAVTATLPIEDPGPGGNNLGIATLWDWPQQNTQPGGVGTPVVPFPDLAGQNTHSNNPSNDLAGAAGTAIPGLAAPATAVVDPASIGSGQPAISTWWGTSLNNTCLASTAFPIGIVYQRMSQTLTVNMDANTAAGGNNYLCGLIAADIVYFNLTASNTNYYFFGQIIANQIQVQGASSGSTLTIINPLNPQPSLSPQAGLPGFTMPGTLKYADVARGLAAQAGWEGRNFFLPIFRSTPPMATRAVRFRPNSQLSILLINGVTPSVAGYNLVVPGGVYPWTPTTANTATTPTTQPSYNGMWWPTDSANMIFTSEGEIMGDLFGPAATAVYPDNLVFTLSGAQ